MSAPRENYRRVFKILREVRAAQLPVDEARTMLSDLAEEFFASGPGPGSTTASAAPRKRRSPPPPALHGMEPADKLSILKWRAAVIPSGAELPPSTKAGAQTWLANSRHTSGHATVVFRANATSLYRRCVSNPNPNPNPRPHPTPHPHPKPHPHPRPHPNHNPTKTTPPQPLPLPLPHPHP
jgi:hypothetical protein